MTEDLRRVVRQSITDLSCGLPAEPVLLRLLRAVEAYRPPSGQKEEP